MNKTEIYDISDYSDEELFEVLDLQNPSDRELEAKILMMIHKYEQSQMDNDQDPSEYKIS